MPFLDEYRASRTAGGGGADVATLDAVEPDAAQDEVVRDWLTARPEAMLEELREHAPTLVIGRLAFVTRYDDVRDVLGHHDAFSVAPYGEAITRINRGPNFLLGMDDGPEYQAQLSLMRRVFRREDASLMRELTAARVAEVLAPARDAGRLDVTEGYGRLVTARVAGDYFGVPGPDAETLMKWARTIFTDGFVNVLQLPLLHRRAMRASREFRDYLDGLIAEVRAQRGRGTAAPQTVVQRLVALSEAGDAELTDEGIRDILLWTIAGMIDNVNAAVGSVIDRLLGEPDVLPGAVDAARADDRTRLRTYVLEALRFHTPTPFATRRCVRDFTLASGTPREKTIPADALTLVGLGAAMMDGTVIDAPGEFRLDRPDDHYLHFGVGLHACLGRHLAEALVVEMVGAVLRLDGLRRARGVSGRFRRVGVFPKKFLVDFTATPAEPT